MEDLHYLVTRKPRNELLKKLVAYCYFHASDDAQREESFYFYPNYLHALTIYKGNEVNVDHHNKRSLVRPSANRNKFTCLYTVNLKDRLYVDLKGGFYKVGIVFYPLGINHFIDASLNTFMQHPFQEIVLDKAFYPIITRLSKEQSIDEQLATVEEALLAAWHAFDSTVLQKAVREIVLSNGTVKADALEKATGVSRKTLLRLFRKHLLSSMEEYKKMVMFRNSLNYALQHKELVNLTDIALYNMYYDQSHFIRHFKSITSETPKTLLPKIVQIGNEDLYWHFLGQ